MIESVIVVDENIYACGTKYLNVYDFLGEVKESVFIYGWKYAKSQIIDSTMYFAYIPRDSEGDGVSAIKIIRKGKTPVQINLHDKCRQFTFYGKSIYCASLNDVSSYSLEGVLDRTLQLPVTFDKILKAEGGYIYAARADAVFQIPVK